MTAISWTAEDHGTGYHDRRGSSGAAFVVRGAIRHERLHPEGAPDGPVVPAGGIFCFDNAFIRRMRRE